MGVNYRKSVRSAAHEDVSSYPNTYRGYVQVARWYNAYSTLTRLAPLKVQAKLACQLSYKRKMAEGLYLVLQWAVLRRSPSPAANGFTWIQNTTHLLPLSLNHITWSLSLFFLRRSLCLFSWHGSSRWVQRVLAQRQEDYMHWCVGASSVLAAWRRAPRINFPSHVS